MEALLPPLRIQVTKTRDGKMDYMQITSNDQFALNIVLVSQEITVEDCRDPEPPPKSPSKRRRKRGVQS